MSLPDHVGFIAWLSINEIIKVVEHDLDGIYNPPMWILENFSLSAFHHALSSCVIAQLGFGFHCGYSRRHRNERCARPMGNEAYAVRI